MKTYIVPGGTGQIGSEAVKMLLRHKVHVIVPSISGKKDRLPDEVEIIKCDYRNDTEVRKLKVKADGMIYMAGVWTGHSRIPEVNDVDVCNSVTSEICGFWNFLRNVMPTERLIAMGSFSMGQGKPYLGAHSMVKTALQDIIRTIANEYGPSGLRANMIAPTIVHTQTEEKLYPSVHTKYLVPVNAIVDCIELLCFDFAGEYINGQTIGLCSPWPKYLEDRIRDLQERGCTHLTRI